MARPLTRKQTAELADVLQALLDRVEEGDLVASIDAIRRIEGAKKALKVVLGESDVSELDVPE